VRIRTLVAPLLGTNCYVVSDRSDRCVVVDPGGGVFDTLRRSITESHSTPTAVLITHGHLDHTWDAAQVSAEYSIPVLIHAEDAYRLDDPIGTLGPLGGQIAALAGASSGPPRPDLVEVFVAGDDGVVELGPLLGGPGEPLLTGVHAPGHTEGSTVFLVPGPNGPDAALTGDVLFAGSIGRMDLPGGDPAAMERTLRRLARLDPGTEVLPGHGPGSTIAVELADNPYLRAAR
jgi:hydroxyacylglutathione hydrolase